MGVPQGSMLSVSLFSIRINSIVKHLPFGMQCSLYVEDFVISYSSPYLNTAELSSHIGDTCKHTHIFIEELLCLSRNTHIIIQTKTRYILIGNIMCCPKVCSDVENQNIVQVELLNIQ